MADEKSKDKKTDTPRAESVEIITDAKKVPNEAPILTVRTGATQDKTFFVKINQPTGRALLIAVHL